MLGLVEYRLMGSSMNMLVLAASSLVGKGLTSGLLTVGNNTTAITR